MPIELSNSLVSNPSVPPGPIIRTLPKDDPPFSCKPKVKTFLVTQDPSNEWIWSFLVRILVPSILVYSPNFLQPHYSLYHLVPIHPHQFLSLLPYLSSFSLSNLSVRSAREKLRVRKDQSLEYWLYKTDRIKGDSDIVSCRVTRCRPVLNSHHFLRL